GQDPYHGTGQANGLAFAVSGEQVLPPSLQNIFKEIESDLCGGLTSAKRDGGLERWAEQGVLLLNATLTVRAHTPGSHQEKGWELFTDAAIKALSEEREHLVFILWGNYAKRKGMHIDRSKHLVLESPHPSPFSAASGFFGSRPFSKTNEYLIAHRETPIDWL
ncbi:MAG TPA: uracil-DNA glycosylase, partial [Candidatus Paceibacterota bacterium]|nr:uracil-DNA glycosylase [Candidatus Paceibacterota bacterium]